MLIIPTILTRNPQELKARINLLEGKTDRVQIDIVDGVFADNKTIDPSTLTYVDTNLRLDFQLMVKEPINWVEKCASAGADRILGHLELMSDQATFIHQVKQSNLSVGLALDLPTPLHRLSPGLLPKLDNVLLMSVKAGFGGRSFDPAVLPKLESLVSLRSQTASRFTICVDGGITLQLAKRLAAAGADELAIGKSLFKGNLSENLNCFSDLAL